MHSHERLLVTQVFTVILKILCMILLTVVIIICTAYLN